MNGRPVAKRRCEYTANSGPVSTLVYLFPDDAGTILELVFVVKASRYPALRSQLESIQSGSITGPG